MSTSTHQPLWQIDIKSVQAEFWKLFSCSDPLHLTVHLRGTARGRLQSDFKRASDYQISFDVKTGVYNYEDEDDYMIRMGRFRVKEVPFLVVQALTTTSIGPSDLPAAFTVEALADPMHEALDSYLNERFCNKPPQTLLPDFDLDSWLEKQRKSKLQMPPANDSDGADWWKRGDPPTQ